MNKKKNKEKEKDPTLKKIRKRLKTSQSHLSPLETERGENEHA